MKTKLLNLVTATVLTALLPATILAQATDSAAFDTKPSPPDISASTPGTPAAAVVAAAPESSEIQAAVQIPAGMLFGSFAKSDGPFRIMGSVIVPSGQTLEFGPGCVVYVGGAYSTITVFGQIVAKGTETDPVVFMSANPKPNPWDWDRIYCRSKSRAIFEHCIIRNSNYGIYVENGSADIVNCRFERNSLHGLVAKNSDVRLDASLFTGGHALAVLLKAGAQVQSDSLVIRDNVTAIACDEKSSLSVNGGSISRNSNGIVVVPGSAVSIVATEITRNKIGIITRQEIPRKTREMVYGNAYDVKMAVDGEIERLLKEPESVRSVILPKTATKIDVKKDFSAGFSAVSAPQEATASFIGNVTIGAGYYIPKTNPNPITDTVVVQSRYPHGIQPEIQVFASGKRGAADVNLLMDLYGNEWLSTSGYVGKNMFNLSLAYAQQALVFGDFFESGSETSIAGRQMTGFKLSGSMLEMGGGTKRIDYRLAAGESEIPKDSGDHEINLYNETVDSGMSARQQITYVAAATVKPTRYSSITAKGIIARDQITTPLFRAPISDPGAPQPIQAQTGCIDGKISLLNGAMEIFAELDLGAHDTIDSAGIDEVAWYNPKVEEALPRVFSLLNPDDFRESYAASFGGRGSYKGYDLTLSFMQIAPDYFSAGNPYLENDRRTGVLTAGKQFLENLTASSELRYERTNIEAIPTDRGDLNLRSEYALGENKPALSMDYTFRVSSTSSSEKVTVPDPANPAATPRAFDQSFDDREVNNLIGIEGKQNLENGMSYSMRYQFLWDNDISEHPNTNYEDKGDGMQHQVSGWYSFKYKKLLRNKTSLRAALKNENRDSLTGHTYKISDQLNITIIPRKLSVNLSGEYSRKKDQKFNSSTSFGTLGWQAPVYTTFYGTDAEAKYSINAKISATVKGRYEKSVDESDGSPENFDVKIGGAYVTFLF